MRALALLAAVALLASPLARVPAAAAQPPAPPAAEPAAAPPATAAPPAAPDDTAARERARAHSERGRRHYELGEYGAAIAAYRAAYLTLPSPGVLFNLGQAFRMGGHCSAAVHAYRTFLQSDPSGPARELAGQQLTGVVTCARDAERAAVRRDRRLRTGGLVTGGAGLALSAAALYFALDASRIEDDIEARARGGARWSELAELDARGERSAALATGLAIGGGVAVATGAVLYVLGSRREHSERTAAPWIAPVGATAVGGASWQF